MHMVRQPWPTLLFLSILCSCLSCQRIDSGALFVSWFLNPDQVKAQKLAQNNLSAHLVDSIVARQHSQAQSGAYSLELRDVDSVPYTLGVYAPPPSHHDSLLPLIIYLHGGIGTMKNTKGVQAWEMFRPLTDSFPLLLASPSANRFAPWWSAQGLNRILQSVRYMTLHYPVDPDRIFLAGVSDGATGCYAAANAICSPFAGFFAISGFGGMLPRLGVPLYPQNLMQRPIYNVNAGNDRLYPVDQVQQFLDWLIAQGVPVQRKIYKDEQHGFDYRAQEWATLAKFVRTWRRPSRPGVSWHILPSLPNRADNLLGWTATSDVAMLNAYWQVDTLYTAARGVRSATIITNGSGSKVAIKERAGVMRGTVPLAEPTTRQKLALMQHDCFPRQAASRVLQVTF